MAEISIYHLSVTNIEKTLPKLLEKILSSGSRAVLLTGNIEQMELINNYLWSFSTKILIPHGSQNDPYPEEQPIYITTHEDNPNKADVLVSITACESKYYNKFNRFIFIFMDEDEVGKRFANELSKQQNVTYWAQDMNSGAWVKRELA